MGSIQCTSVQLAQTTLEVCFGTVNSRLARSAVSPQRSVVALPQAETPAGCSTGSHVASLKRAIFYRSLLLVLLL